MSSGEFKVFRGGLKLPLIGLGTYLSPMECSNKSYYVEVFRYAFEIGYRLIDTAEAYNCSEEVVGEALRGFRRDEFVVVSKVWPTHARFDDVVKSALASSRRLGTYIDLYLLHWPSRDVPISETIRAFEKLIDDGVVRFMGVSNFTLEQLQEAMASARKYEVVADEVRYNVEDRSIERDLLPFSEREGIAVIAYSPLAVGSLTNPQNPAYRILKEVADEYNATPAQIALAWLMDKPTVVPIPKATKREHLKENIEATKIKLKQKHKQKIDQLKA